MVGAFLDGRDGVIERVVRGDHDDGESCVFLANLPEEIKSFTVRKAKIKQDHVWLLIRDHLQPLLGGVGGGGAVAFASEDWAMRVA